MHPAFGGRTVLSLDFKSLCMWKPVAGWLFQRDITKDKLGEGRLEGIWAQRVWVLLAEPGLKTCWLSSHLWSLCL